MGVPVKEEIVCRAQRPSDDDIFPYLFDGTTIEDYNQAKFIEQNNNCITVREWHERVLTRIDGGIITAESACIDLKSKMNKVRPRAAVYSIHLQFLINSLKKYLSDDVLSLASDTRRMLLSASPGGIGAGKGMGNGPEGLAALENLERLGRVYVMCLGE